VGPRFKKVPVSNKIPHVRKAKNVSLFGFKDDKISKALHALVFSFKDNSVP
jgi:hypothetical protein